MRVAAAAGALLRAKHDGVQAKRRKAHRALLRVSGVGDQGKEEQAYFPFGQSDSSSVSPLFVTGRPISEGIWMTFRLRIEQAD